MFVLRNSGLGWLQSQPRKPLNRYDIRNSESTLLREDIKIESYHAKVPKTQSSFIAIHLVQVSSKVIMALTRVTMLQTVHLVICDLRFASIEGSEMLVNTRIA